jgi:hypothetical protein
MTRTSALRNYLDELARQVAGDLRTDDYSRVLYSTDASIYQVEPLGVVRRHHHDPAFLGAAAFVDADVGQHQ